MRLWDLAFDLALILGLACGRLNNMDSPKQHIRSYKNIQYHSLAWLSYTIKSDYLILRSARALTNVRKAFAVSVDLAIANKDWGDLLKRTHRPL